MKKKRKRKVRERVCTHECDNCSALWEEGDLKPAADLSERVDPGGVMPSGECPDCGALCYPRWSAAVSEMRELLNDLLEWAERMGGFDADVWTKARAMRDRLADEGAVP